MPLFFQQEVDATTRLAVWKIAEPEDFFLASVPLQRKITHPHKRLQHLAGRFLLQHLFPDFPINLIQIADTRKPFLPDEAYHFSISHCSDYAAAIVSRKRRVGIDIEVPTPKVQKIRHKFLHPDELGWVAERTEEENAQVSQLTLLWSGKEAVFKWWSYGAVDFSEMIRLQPFSVQLEGQFPAAFVDGATTHPLTLQYKFFDDLCLAWLAQ